MQSNQQEKINQLQQFEQNLQLLLNQKQTFQAQLLEVENALSELERSPRQVYKILGNIMVAAEASTTIQELQERQHVLELRIKAIEKQESTIKEKAEQLQESLVKELK